MPKTTNIYFKFWAHPKNGETKYSTVPEIPISIITITVITITVITITVITITVITIKKNGVANANPLFKSFITY